MDKAKRDLKSTSVIIIVLAIFDLIGAIASVALPNGAYSYETLVNITGMAPSLASTTVNSTVGVAILVFLLLLFVGLKGIIVSNGGKRSRLATAIVSLCTLAMCLQIAATCYALFMGTTDFMHSRLIVQVTVIVILILYNALTKKVISLRKTSV